MTARNDQLHSRRQECAALHFLSVREFLSSIFWRTRGGESWALIQGACPVIKIFADGEKLSMGRGSKGK